MRHMVSTLTETAAPERIPHVQAAATIGSLQGACDAHVAHIQALKRELDGALTSLVQARARRDEHALTIAELNAQLSHADAVIANFRQCVTPTALKNAALVGLRIVNHVPRGEKLPERDQALANEAMMLIDKALANGGYVDDPRWPYHGRYPGDMDSMLRLRDETHEFERRHVEREKSGKEDTIVT